MRELVGQVRRSQMITTFGVGAMVDLPNVAAMVAGTDAWPVTECQPISEPRLLSCVRGVLGQQVDRILSPPTSAESTSGGTGASDAPGVPVTLFPTWLVCPRCHHLGRADSGVFELIPERFRVERTRYVHLNCEESRAQVKSKFPTAIPARFIIACTHGHVDDFPWSRFVHRGESNCSHRLRLLEYGVSGEAADVEVKCETCGARRRMTDAFGPESEIRLSPCTGYHPHLGIRDDGCEGEVQTILLGASNSWFPISLSVLSVPQARTKLAHLVESHWLELSQVRDKSGVELLRNIGRLSDFHAYSDDEIWDAVHGHAEVESEGEVAFESVKAYEWEALSAPDPSRNGDRFKLSQGAVPSGYGEVIEKIVLVERLCEVRALVGFTRIESPGDLSEMETLPPERRASLCRGSTLWVPGVGMTGEGLFIQIREDAVRRWETMDAVRERERVLERAHDAWVHRRKWMKSPPSFPGIRYVLLHSLSHALVTELGLRCGYSAASVRERIYCNAPQERNTAMCGVLVATSTPDSEGSLGGLVSLGQASELGPILGLALQRAELCAADPLCSRHDPTTDSSLHVAACHSCLFVPETSCERGNRYLDRGTLVDTASTSGTAFFGVRQ